MAAAPTPAEEAGLKPVTAGEIDVVQFTQVGNVFSRRHGYDEDEVDEFLDRCAATIVALTRERDAARVLLERAEQSVTS